jgi:hypothetical protein
VLIDSEKFVIHWSAERNGWVFTSVKKRRSSQELTQQYATSMIRLCSFFESGEAD